MVRDLPAKWDMEADLVSIGAGIGGLAAAISAQDNGLSALVLERSDQVGGVAAQSQGQVWIAGNHLAREGGIEDSVDSGFRYLKRLSMDYGDDRAILNLVAHAHVALRWFEEKIGLRMFYIRGCPDYYYMHSNDSVAEGRLLEVEPFPAKTLGEWQDRTRISPHVPYGLTTQDIADAGGLSAMLRWDYALMAKRLENDERCVGPGLGAWFVKGAIDRGIPMETGVSVEELFSDGERVTGLRAVKDGRDLIVKANKGVVVAVSSYERRHDYNKTMARTLESLSMVPATVDGANFRLACPLGARTAIVPEITSLGFIIPGEEDAEEPGKPIARSSMPFIGLPHHIVVNRKGERFGNESFYRSFYYKFDEIDGGTQTHPNFPCWIILDAQAREKYALASLMPGQEWPAGFGHTADTIGELADKAGIDRKGLEATVARFNASAERGEDPDYGRGTHPWSAWMTGDPLQKPNANLGPLSKGPFHAVEQSRMGTTAIPATGLLTNTDMQVIGWDDKPIAGLYAAGNSVARLETGAVMQSGISNARGMTHGWLIGQHAAGRPSGLLAEEMARLGV